MITMLNIVMGKPEGGSDYHVEYLIGLM